MSEHVIWKGSTSQWMNTGYYLICVPLAIVFGAGLIMAIWRYLETRYHVYEITSQRIIEHKGVFSKTTNDLELYRIKDIRLVQPFLLRLVGLSNLALVSSDRTDHTIYIMGIPNGPLLKEHIRNAVEKVRDSKRVREIDFD